MGSRQFDTQMLDAVRTAIGHYSITIFIIVWRNGRCLSLEMITSHEWTVEVALTRKSMFIFRKRLFLFFSTQKGLAIIENEICINAERFDREEKVERFHNE